MDLLEKILEVYPEITSEDYSGAEKTIVLADEGDGVQYIARWDYDKPIPKGMKVGK